MAEVCVDQPPQPDVLIIAPAELIAAASTYVV